MFQVESNQTIVFLTKYKRYNKILKIRSLKLNQPIILFKGLITEVYKSIIKKKMHQKIYFQMKIKHKMKINKQTQLYITILYTFLEGVII